MHWVQHTGQGLELRGFEVLQEEVDRHIQSLYGSTRPQQMLFAESAGQLRLEAAAEDGQGAARVAAALPIPSPMPRSGQPAGGLAARLAPANGIAQPREAEQLLAGCASQCRSEM